VTTAKASRLAGVWLLIHTLAAAAWAGEPAPCEGTAPADRVAAWHAQIVTDPLHRYAVEAFGTPTGCQARIDSEDPEGPRYGALVVLFGDDARYLVESSPPETGRMSLRAERGLPHSAAARAALAEQAAAIGLEIDWQHPIGKGGVERFDDPTPGLNASVELRTESGKLVEVMLRMAL
jgi:hypothetical protein